MTVPHIYADVGAAHVFVFGGLVAERARTIRDYLTRNPNGIVFGTDDTEEYRIPWHLVDGKVTAGPPMRQKSGFLGWSTKFMKPPGPEDFRTTLR
jgi:hypothetical protein